MSDRPAASVEDLPAREPMPGIRLITYRIPACGIAGEYLHMDQADIHVTYTQVVGRTGQFPAQGISYGLRTVPGRDVNRCSSQTPPETPRNTTEKQVEPIRMKTTMVVIRMVVS